MQSKSNKIRLDQLLVQKDLAPSRSRAGDMIARGVVLVDGKAAKKAGVLVAPDCKIQTNDPASSYVSRAALKLIAGLNACSLDIRGMNALDLGASTGGFTQVLLEHGAKSVTAIDVGHGQMVADIADDPRVTNIEGCNARHLTPEELKVPPNLVVSDVSFISLKLAAEPALKLCTSNAYCILLVKPQFEVGRDGIGKGGIVKSAELVESTNANIKDWFNSLDGWAITHFLPSPIKGGDGNEEFLLCGARRG